MKNRAQLLSNLTAALILSGITGTALAQDAENPRQQGPREAIISVDFNGGSLTELIEAIRGSGQNINILIPPDADEVAVPGLSLKEVTVEAALRAIANVASNERINVDTSVQRLYPGQPVFSLRIDLDRTMGPRPDTRIVEVYSIRMLTDSLPGDPEGSGMTTSSETILTAIDTGLAVSDTGGEKPVIRFHEESGLIFVRANGMQQNLINSVLRNMERDQQLRRQAQQRASSAGGPSGPRRGGRQDR